VWSNHRSQLMRSDTIKGGANVRVGLTYQVADVRGGIFSGSGVRLTDVRRENVWTRYCLDSSANTTLSEHIAARRVSIFSPSGIATPPAGLYFTDVTFFFKCKLSPSHSTTGGPIATRTVALTPSMKKLLQIGSSNV